MTPESERFHCKVLSAHGVEVDMGTLAIHRMLDWQSITQVTIFHQHGLLVNFRGSISMFAMQTQDDCCALITHECIRDE